MSQGCSNPGLELANAFSVRVKSTDLKSFATNRSMVVFSI